MESRLSSASLELLFGFLAYRRLVTGGCQHLTPATLPKAFHEEHGRMLSRVEKTYVDVFDMLLRFIEKFAESEISSLDISFGSIISRHSFFKAVCNVLQMLII